MDLLVLIIAGAVTLFILLIPVFMLVTVARIKSPDQESDKNRRPCETCGYYTQGLLRCPECGQATDAAYHQKLVKLLGPLPTEIIRRRLPGPLEQPTIVFCTDIRLISRVLRRHLFVRGIQSRVQRSSSPAGRFQIVVWSEDRELAEAIVDRLWPATQGLGKP